MLAGGDVELVAVPGANDIALVREKDSPKLVLSSATRSSTRAMILPWQTGPPMCGQTFSKAVNVPSWRNTPTATPSTSTTLRPGSGNAATLPIAISRMGLSLAVWRGSLWLAPAIPHRQVEEDEISSARSISLTTSTTSVGVIFSAVTRTPATRLGLRLGA